MIWIALIVGLTIIGFFIYGSWMSIQWQKEHRGESTIATDDHFYLKIFYSNVNDKRVFIPKKSGAGYTINFGNPVSVIAGSVVIVGMLYAIFDQSAI